MMQNLLTKAALRSMPPGGPSPGGPSPGGPSPGGPSPGGPSQAAMPTQPAGPDGASERPRIKYEDMVGAINKQSILDRHLQGLTKGKGAIQRKDVMNMAVDLVAKRVMSAQEMAGYLNSLPSEPEQIREWAMKHAASVEGNLDRMVMMLEGAANQQRPSAPAMQPGAPGIRSASDAPGIQPGEAAPGTNIGV